MKSDRGAIIAFIFLSPILCCSCMILATFIRFYQPWLPYTQPEIQHALEEHYGVDKVRLRSFWKDRENCKVAIADVWYGEWEHSSMRYVTLKRKSSTEKWEFVMDEGNGGLVPMSNCT